MDLNLRQTRYFLAVAEERHFSATWRLVRSSSRTPSAVSSLRTWWLSAGWETNSRAAARL